MREEWKNHKHRDECCTPQKTSLAILAPQILSEIITAIDGLEDFEAILIKNAIMDGKTPRESVRYVWNMAVSKGGSPSKGLKTLSAIFAAESFIHQNLFGFLQHATLELMPKDMSRDAVGSSLLDEHLGVSPIRPATDTSDDGTTFIKADGVEKKKSLNKPKSGKE